MFIKGAREVQGERRVELVRTMLSRSLHSQRIFRNALQSYTLFYFCTIPIYMDFNPTICQIDRKHRHFVRISSSARYLNATICHLD